jgi:hypothetical protein
MEQCLKLPNRYAMILDAETINAVIAHAAELNLPRRECHPLDRYRGKCANAVLAKYDAEVDAAPLTSEELDTGETAVDEAEASGLGDAGLADDDF